MNNERRSGFAPKLRRGETMLVVPPGMEITRINGRLYAVPEKGNDPYYGGSAYTKRQIAVISRLHLSPEKGLDNNRGAW